MFGVRFNFSTLAGGKCRDVPHVSTSAWIPVSRYTVLNLYIGGDLIAHTPFHHDSLDLLFGRGG